MSRLKINKDKGAVSAKPNGGRMKRNIGREAEANIDPTET